MSGMSQIALFLLSQFILLPGVLWNFVSKTDCVGFCSGVFALKWHSNVVFWRRGSFVVEEPSDAIFRWHVPLNVIAFIMASNTCSCDSNGSSEADKLGWPDSLPYQQPSPRTRT